MDAYSFALFFAFYAGFNCFDRFFYFVFVPISVLYRFPQPQNLHSSGPPPGCIDGCSPSMKAYFLRSTRFRDPGFPPKSVFLALKKPQKSLFEGIVYPNRLVSQNCDSAVAVDRRIFVCAVPRVICRSSPPHASSLRRRTTHRRKKHTATCVLVRRRT